MSGGGDSFERSAGDNRASKRKLEQEKKRWVVVKWSEKDNGGRRVFLTEVIPVTWLVGNCRFRYPLTGDVSRMSANFKPYKEDWYKLSYSYCSAAFFTFDMALSQMSLGTTAAEASSGEEVVKTRNTKKTKVSETEEEEEEEEEEGSDREMAAVESPDDLFQPSPARRKEKKKRGSLLRQKKSPSPKKMNQSPSPRCWSSGTTKGRPAPSSEPPLLLRRPANASGSSSSKKTVDRSPDFHRHRSPLPPCSSGTDGQGTETRKRANFQPISMEDFTYEWLMFREEMRFMRNTTEKLNQAMQGRPAEDDDEDPLPCLSSMEEFNIEDRKLHDNAHFRRRSRQLKRIGGETCAKAVKAALRSLMTPNLMRMFNKVGLGKLGKRGLKATKLYVLIMTALSTYDDAKKDKAIGEFLKTFKPTDDDDGDPVA